MFDGILNLAYSMFWRDWSKICSGTFTSSMFLRMVRTVSFASGDASTSSLSSVWMWYAVATFWSISRG